MAPFHRQQLLLVALTSLVFYLVTAEDSTPNGLKNEARKTQIMKRSASIDESFFGNLDIESIKESHRKAMQSSFFNSKNNPEPKLDYSKSSGGRPMNDCRSEDEKEKKETEDHQEDNFSPPYEHQEEEKKDNNKNNLPISSLETARKFSCTKRALMSYMRIVVAISTRLEALTENSNHHQYTLQLMVNFEEAQQLKRHIITLRGLYADYKPSGKRNEAEEEEQSEPEKIKRFCANLDDIEEPIDRLIKRTVMLDPVTKKRTTTNPFWGSSLNAWVISHLNMKGVTLSVIALITSIIVHLFLLRAGVPSTRKYVFAIVLLVLGLSMLQFFHQEKAKFTAEQQKKLNIVLDAALDCDWTEKAGNLLTWNGYKCSSVVSSSSSKENKLQPPPVIPETDVETLFWKSHFNILAFFLKWAIWICFLGPFKEVSLEVDRIFEIMVDGKTSKKWWDVGAYFRSVLFSSLTKPLFVVIIFVLLFKFGFSISLFLKWATMAMNWALNEQQNEEEEVQRNRANRAINTDPRSSHPLQVAGAVPQQPQIHIINNHHYHPVPLPFPSVDNHLLAQRPLPSVLRHRAVPATVNGDDDDEDEYFSAKD